MVFSNLQGCEFEAVVKESGAGHKAGVQVDVVTELKASDVGRAVIATIPGSQLEFAVKRVEDGGVCTGYTLSNKKLKDLGFRVVKWKHVTPGPDDKDEAATHEDAIAWFDML